MSYGLLAEFAGADRLRDAARAARARGFRRVEAYSPFPIEGLADDLGLASRRVPLVTLLGGIAGGLLGYGLQYYSAVIDYPLNAGGRPLHSWPAFIPVTFEMTVLGAALAAFFSVLFLSGLPRFYHPLQSVKEFDLASRNRFFLCIRAGDPRYAEARPFFAALEPLCIIEAP